MKEFDSLELLDGVDEKFIASAENTRKRTPFLKAALPVAAALCLAAGALFAVKAAVGGKEKPDVSAMASDKPAVIETAAPVQTEGHTDAPVLTEEPKKVITIGDLFDMGYIRSAGFANEAIESPETVALIRPLLVYQGRVYYQCSSVTPLYDLVGNELAVIDRLDLYVNSDFITEDAIQEEGSPVPTEELYTVECELKGSMEGKLYSVKDFDPERTVCMRGSDGETVVFICEDGLEGSGSALFENVFGLSQRLAGVTYYDADPAGKVGEYRLLLERSAASAPMQGLIDAFAEGEWHTETRTEPDGKYRITLTLDNGFSFVCRISDDGKVSIGENLNMLMSGRYLQVDNVKLRPLLDLIDAGAGYEYAVSFNRFYTLEDCRANSRFGYLVPKTVPEGYWARNTSIRPILNDDREVTGTGEMWIEYKNPATEAVISIEYFPIDRLEKETSYLISLGGEVVELEKLTVGDIIVSGHVGDYERGFASHCAVTHGDTVIVVEAIDASAEEVFELLQTILN
ncbi:MAG: hypothetical protein IKH31_01860 [Clostridia bacterium]|nr:hypothetical protein [Clostridia bacterium]